MRRNVGLGLVVALGATVATPAAATTTAARPTTVVVIEDQGVLQPSATARFTHRCPARAPHPVGGTFGPPNGTPLAGQYALAASHPLDRT